jgi:hypothetical protein
MIVNAVLENSTLVSCTLQIQMDDCSDFLTADDMESITQHIKAHRDQIMKELNQLKWMNGVDASKIESLPPGISQLIYDYVVPADHRE